MTAPIQPWLIFFRVRLLPTALSNLLLGVYLGAGSVGIGSPGRLTASLALSGCLYLFGMGLNDYRDRERDRTLHPNRPLPRGDITLGSARWGLGALFVSSVALGAGLGWPTRLW